METSSRMGDVVSPNTQMMVSLSALLCPRPSLDVLHDPRGLSVRSLECRGAPCHCGVNAPL